MLKIKYMFLLFHYQLWLFAPQQSQDVISIFEEVEKAFKGKVLKNYQYFIYFFIKNKMYCFNKFIIFLWEFYTASLCPCGN